MVVTSAPVLVPLSRSAPAPGVLAALVPPLLLLGAVRHLQGGHVLLAGCLSGAAVTWVGVGLAVFVPSPGDLAVQRLGLMPLALVVVALGSLPQGFLGRRRYLVLGAGVVAVLGGIGVVLPILALFGAVLVVSAGHMLWEAGRAISRTTIDAVALNLAMALALLAVEVTGHTGLASARASSDAVDMSLVAAGLGTSFVLDGRRRIWRGHGSPRLDGGASHQLVGNGLGIALGCGPMDLLFPSGEVGEGFVDADGGKREAPDAPHSEFHGADGALIAVLMPPVTIRRDLRAPVEDLLVVTSRRALLRLRQQSQAKLLGASRRRLAAASDNERQRIERDMERTVLRRVRVMADALEHVGGTSPLRSRLDDVQGDLARLAQGLDPIAGDSLVTALQRLADRAGAVRVEVSCAQEPSPAVARTVWFIAAEAVTNARKHAPGSGVEVSLTCAGRRSLVLCVRDQGPGGADPQGHGLIGIADRAEAVGGRLVVKSGPDGTVIEAELPTGLPVGDSRADHDPHGQGPDLGSPA